MYIAMTGHTESEANMSGNDNDCDDISRVNVGVLNLLLIVLLNNKVGFTIVRYIFIVRMLNKYI